MKPKRSRRRTGQEIQEKKLELDIKPDDEQDFNPLKVAKEQNFGMLWPTNRIFRRPHRLVAG